MMVRAGPLAVVVAYVASTQAALAQSETGARPDPPYLCATMDLSPSKHPDREALFADVPVEGPILIPHQFKAEPPSFTVMRATIGDVLPYLTFTVTDSAGNTVEGRPVEVSGLFLSWYPVEALAQGSYVVEVNGPEQIVVGDCLVSFTPAQISVNVGTTSVADWVNAAELTLTDSSEVMRPSPVDCCAVVAEQCTEGVDCVQCWDYTTAPVFSAEWTGEGLSWLTTNIDASSGELTQLGNGTDSIQAQFIIVEFGELCVEGSIAPTGGEPTRTVESCRTITSASPLEREGRTRVDVESCGQAPYVEEGTRGLLVHRAETEEQARSLVESSPYAPAEGFFPTNDGTASPNSTMNQDASVDDEFPDSPQLPASDSATNDEPVSDDDALEQDADANGQASSNPASHGSSGCGVARPRPPSWFGWALVAVLGVVRRRKPSTRHLV